MRATLPQRRQLAMTKEPTQTAQRMPAPPVPTGVRGASRRHWTVDREGLHWLPLLLSVMSHGTLPESEADGDPRPYDIGELPRFGSV